MAGDDHTSNTHLHPREAGTFLGIYYNKLFLLYYNEVSQASCQKENYSNRGREHYTSEHIFFSTKR